MSFPRTARKSPVPETAVSAHPFSLPNPGASLTPGHITLAELRFSATKNAEGGWGEGRTTPDSLDGVVLGFSTGWRNGQNHAWLR